MSMSSTAARLVPPLIERGRAFINTPASALPLAVFRIGLAAVLLFQALALASDLLELYGARGVVQWSVFDPRQGDSVLLAGVPRIGWVVEVLAPLGVDESTCVRGVFVLYVASLGCLLIGWRTRAAALVAWLTHLAMNTSAIGSIYGADMFAHVALFYCLWMPIGARLSVDRLGAAGPAVPTAWARLSLRVLQLHLCIAYLAAGLEKAVGAQWWNGEAIWRALMLPNLAQFDFQWLAAVAWLAMLIGWSTLLIELGYPLLIWPRRTRGWMAWSTIGMHAGIGLTMGLVSFSAIMIVLTASAFLVTTENSGLETCSGWFGRLAN